MKTNHSVNIQWSEKDQVFVATVPEIEGLNAFGDTPAEALKELDIAKELVFKVMEEDNEEIPDAVVYNSHSGQIRIRIPKTLHASLVSEARNECISLNTYIVSLLSERNAFSKVRKELESIKPQVLINEERPSSGATYVDGSFSGTWGKQKFDIRLFTGGSVQ